MKTEKNVYETPSVKKVEFDFNVRIAASTCGSPMDSMSPCNFGM